LATLSQSLISLCLDENVFQLELADWRLGEGCFLLEVLDYEWAYTNSQTKRTSIRKNSRIWSLSTDNLDGRVLDKIDVHVFTEETKRKIVSGTECTPKICKTFQAEAETLRKGIYE